MKADFNKHCTTHAFVAADLKTRFYWVYKGDLIQVSHVIKPVRKWHQCYFDILKVGFVKKKMNLLETTDVYVDIGDEQNVPVGVGPEPVEASDNEPDAEEQISSRTDIQGGDIQKKDTTKNIQHNQTQEECATDDIPHDIEEEDIRLEGDIQETESGIQEAEGDIQDAEGDTRAAEGDIQ